MMADGNGSAAAAVVGAAAFVRRPMLGLRETFSMSNDWSPVNSFLPAADGGAFLWSRSLFLLSRLGGISGVSNGVRSNDWRERSVDG